MQKNLIFTTLIFLLYGYAIGQEANLDWHLIEHGTLRQLITNQGMIGTGRYDGMADPENPNLPEVPYYGPYVVTEYPIGSEILYARWCPNVGAKKGGAISVTAGGPWLNRQYHKEWYPSAAPWDTVWVINNRETTDIPYWPNYTGKSDQDVISRYNDYGPVSLQVLDHNPLGVEVIQVTYSWSTLDFLVHQFHIIPKLAELSDMYVGIFGAGGPNSISKPAGNQPFAYWNDERKLHLTGVKPGGDTPIEGPEGFIIFPDSADGEKDFTYTNEMTGTMALELPPFGYEDTRRYRLMSSPGVYIDPIQSVNYAYFFYSIGPYENVAVNETVRVWVGQILGKGDNGVFKNLELMNWLKGQGWNLPGPPPKPTFSVFVDNHQVTLDWTPVSGNNPEEFTDKYRGDADPDPFEGYRVYKSTISQSGPWTLLAEYDRVDDNIGHNLGLRYQFVDDGLLNNLEYYYSVTSYAKPDSVSNMLDLESSIIGNARIAVPGTAAPDKVGQVAAVPNPYLGDEKYYQYEPVWEKSSAAVGTWMEENRRVQFINLPNPCTIQIYTLSGKLVNIIRHDDSERGYEDWNLTSSKGQAVSSGIYLYTVQDQYNGIQIDKLVIVK